MSVQSGILGHTHDFAFVLTKDCSFHLSDAGDFENLVHLFFIHPGSSSVDTAVTLGEASGILMFSVKPIVKFIDDKDGPTDKYHTDNGFESVGCECQRDAYQWIHINRFHHRLSGKSAVTHPDGIVAEHLAHHSAQIKHCE